MIQLIILLGIISIIDFSTKKIPVVVLVVMGIVGIVSSFYAKQSIISVAVALIPGIVLMAAAFLTGEQIGYGDAAVVTLMGLFVTADIVCSTMVMGLTIAGTISVILIALGRAGRKKQIAFTPFLLLGYGLTEVFMRVENKLNVDLSYGLKGSYTVEGAIIIPIFIVMLAIAMKMGLVLYNEMKADSSYEYATDMWLVDDFYNYQVLKEVVNEF